MIQLIQRLLGLRSLAYRGRSISLQGKRVLITGGSRGLGLAMARVFLSKGARVALCARNEAELKRARDQLLNSLHANAEIFVCDLTRKSEVESMVSQAAQTMGGLDVVVNNAGIIQVGPFEAMSEKDFADSMDANYWSAVHTVFSALPFLKEESRIVNITSIGGAVPVPHLLPYTASKFATLGFSLGLHAELAKKRIRVVTIVPGLMRTGSFVNALFKGKQNKEFGLFSIGAVLPLTAMSASRAASQIVEACEQGDPFCVLSSQAKGMRLLYTIFPGVGATLLGFINGLLPGTSKEQTEGTVSGLQLLSRVRQRGIRILADLASSKLNERRAA